MPFNVSRSASWTDKEILKYPQTGLVVKSVVLDGTDFPVSTPNGDRYVVPAGTILKLSATNPTRMVEYKGSGTIEGILGRPVDMLAQTTANSEPAPMYYFNAVFATSAIVGFTNYASALVHDLNSCLFE